MSEEGTELDEAAARRRQFRLVGSGIALAGVTTMVVASVSTQPHGILVVGLGFAAVATLVLERTQGAVAGLSLGIMTGAIGVWLWPILEPDGSYLFAGTLLTIVGIVNVLLAPISQYFQNAGKRFGRS